MIHERVYTQTYELEDSVGNVFERSEMNSFIGTELSITHISVLFDDRTKELRWHILLSRIDDGGLAR